MMGYGGMMGGGFSIIFWIVIIGVAYYFFKEYNRSNNHRRDQGHGSPDSKAPDRFDNRKEIDHRKDENNPEEIARQRYAKGEISKEELREILDNLNS
jgi:putative membrane protein